MSIRWVTWSSSQDIDSRRPEHVIKENNADEDEDGSGSTSEGSKESQEQLATVRFEDQVDIMAVLLMMQAMQKSIDLFMEKYGQGEGSYGCLIWNDEKNLKEVSCE